MESFDHTMSIRKQVSRFPSELVEAYPASKVFKGSTTEAESTISSTSHSGSSSTMIGGGAGYTCPGRGSVAAGSSRETWKMGWTFMEVGRSSL